VFFDQAFCRDKNVIVEIFDVGSGPGINSKGGESHIPGFGLPGRGQGAFWGAGGWVVGGGGG